MKIINGGGISSKWVVVVVLGCAIGFVVFSFYVINSMNEVFKIIQ